MKNTRIYVAAMAVAMLFVTSCKKEESSVKQEFSATMEVSKSGEKTNLVNDHLQWAHGSDKVSITSISGNSYITSTFTATTHSAYPNNLSYANLDLDQDQTELAEGEGVTYRSIYPASISSENNTQVTLPRVQESNHGELTGYPMYAESSTKSLQFWNLCSVLKLSLKGSGTVNKIEVATDKYINGTFTINYGDNGDPLLISENDGTHTKVTTLTLNEPQQLNANNSKDFYIYLPVQEYNFIRINVHSTSPTTGDRVYTKLASFSSSITLERSRYHLIEFSNVAFVDGLLNGEFSVSATQKVSFAKGNLLSNSNGTTYKFADRQYNISETGYTTSHFNWLNSSSSYGQTMDERNSNITNGGNTTWRVLTQSEWWYLLNQRSGTRRTYHRWSLVSVTKENGSTVAHGMLIYPDKFYWPLEEDKQPNGFEISANYDGHTWEGGSTPNTTYTYDEWCILEAAGCVFLPITGYKTSSTNSSIHEGNYGYYWTRTPRYEENSNESSYIVHFYNAGATFNTNSTTVRLNITNRLAIRHAKYL